MFTIEIRVNSTLITHIYGLNVTDNYPGFREENDGKDHYAYTAYDASSGEVTKGNVSHLRKDDLNTLVVEILKKVAKPKRTRKTK